MCLNVGMNMENVVGGYRPGSSSLISSGWCVCVGKGRGRNGEPAAVGKITQVGGRLSIFKKIFVSFH